MHVNFNTSRPDRWKTDPRKCHINWVILDSDWEAEFCRVAESNPRVKAYVKNHNLGFEVPYLHGSEPKTYLPDFIVLVDDGHGPDDPLHLIVEIKGSIATSLTFAIDSPSPGTCSPSPVQFSYRLVMRTSIA